MTKLEAYIIKRYRSKWIPFKVASKELGFDVMDAVKATYTKECEACSVPKSTAFTAKLEPIKYEIKKYTMPYEHFDIEAECILYSALAKLLSLNMHYQGETA